MGAEITVISSKFYNQFTNGISFGSNLSDYTNNLAGTSIEKIQLLQQINVQWYAVALTSDEWTVTGSSPALVFTRQSGNFLTDGFSVGDTFDFFANWSGVRVYEVSGTVTAISDDGKIMNFTLTAGSFGQASYTNAGIRGTTDLTALIYKFGLIGNDENFNFTSKVSDNDQAYYAAGIGSGGPRSTTFVDMNKQGSYEDWVTGSARVRYVSNPDTYTQQFEIEHTFIINPYFLDGQLPNLQNLILPDLYAGLNTLKYSYQTEWRTVLSNPNTAKIATVENNKGSVAWFNENFNGFDNLYEIESISYEETATGNPANGLLIGSRTTATITVLKTGGSFSAGQKGGLYVSYLPEADEYTDTLTDQVANFIYDNAYATDGGGASAGSDIIKSITSTVSAGKLIIVAQIEYSAAQQARLDGEKYFLIGAQVADSTLSSGNSDRVVLLADVTNYDESADIPGLMDFDTADIYQHNKEFGVDTGFTDWQGYNEDGLMFDFDFYLDLSKDAFLNTLDFLLIAYDSTQQAYFELDKYTMEISGAIVSGGVQQLEIDTTRGYSLIAGDQFNFVKLTTGSKVGNLQHYTGQIGMKVSWQDWINNLNADTVFYDATKPNNNLNYKSSNYSNLNNYQIKMAFAANLTGTSDLGNTGLTDYLFLFPDLTVTDYDLPASPWTGTIETFRASNNENLGGAILIGEDTLMKITWDNDGGAITDITGYWAIHRIEETSDEGYNIDELSTIWDYPTGNRLIPVTGETQLKIEIVAGDVVTSCIIDGSKLTDGVSYNISGRLSDGTGGGSPIPAGAKETEDGQIKETENDDIKIIE